MCTVKFFADAYGRCPFCARMADRRRGPSGLLYPSRRDRSPSKHHTLHRSGHPAMPCDVPTWDSVELRKAVDVTKKQFMRKAPLLDCKEAAERLTPLRLECIRHMRGGQTADLFSPKRRVSWSEVPCRPSASAVYELPVSESYHTCSTNSQRHRNTDGLSMRASACCKCLQP